jgi:hypothetical protein
MATGLQFCAVVSRSQGLILVYFDKMGLFKKDEEAAAEKRAKWVKEKHQKAHALLEKRGFDLTGLIMLDDSFEDGAFEYLLVFPDRVEYINHGKPSLTGKKGKGTEVIPISRISSVSSKKGLIFEQVQITTSGQTIEFKSSPWVAPTLKQTILGLMNSKASEKVSSVSPMEQLKDLAELHKTGVLTDDEFNTKKSELLKRI